jgi:hypothetical protein
MVLNMVILYLYQYSYHLFYLIERLLNVLVVCLKMSLVHFQNLKNYKHLNRQFRLMMEHQQPTQTARMDILQRCYMDFEATLYILLRKKIILYIFKDLLSFLKLKLTIQWNIAPSCYI